MSLDDWRPDAWLGTVADREAVWRVLPFAAGAVVYVAYLLGHAYPAYGAGLFLETAEQIAAHGYGLPARIPGYTAGGIPFAYPPLAFYVLAVLIDVAGADPVAVARFLPGLLAVAYLLPYFGIASELTDDTRHAALATLLFATAPQALKWHVSAGGVVRSMAFLFALASVYAGIRLFRTHDARWLAAGTVTFALVVLTHPTYTVFTVVSYLLVYVALDRSLQGILLGAVVGVGGLVLAAPWWLHVAAVHGVGIFSTAAGTHGGLGAGPGALLAKLTYPIDHVTVHWPFYVLVYLGAIYAAVRRRWFLPAWVLLAVFIVGKNRFAFVPGSILAATFVLDAVVPAVEARVREGRSTTGLRRALPAMVVGLVVLGATVGGVLFAAGAVAGIRGDGAAQPQFADAADHRAAAWAAGNTPLDATFVVLGDAAEWFPYLSDRTMLVGPWGMEWKSTDGYYAQYRRYESISGCRDAACIAGALDGAGVQPDYVYVPTGHYTVFDEAHEQDPSMTESLEASDRFRVVFENEGVVIARVEAG